MKKNKQQKAQNQRTTRKKRMAAVVHHHHQTTLKITRLEKDAPVAALDILDYLSMEDMEGMADLDMEDTD